MTFDSEKTKEQLILENSYLRQVITELEGKYQALEQFSRSIEDRYLNITSAVSDYIFSVHIVDGNPVETVHGPACYAITGYTPKEFYENSYLWINMVYPEDRASVLDHVSKILSGKEVKPIEHRIIRKDGVIRWVRNTPVCQYDEQGRLKTYDGLIQDITDIKRAYDTLRLSEEKFSKAFHSSPDAISIVDVSDNIFLDVNSAFERIFGYSKEEVIGKNAKELNLWVNPYDREAIIEEISHTGKLLNREIRLRTKNGDIITVLVSAEKIVMDDKECLLYVSKDITERIRIFYNLLDQKINFEENFKLLKAKVEAVEGLFMWQFIDSAFSDMKGLNITYLPPQDEPFQTALMSFIDGIKASLNQHIELTGKNTEIPQPQVTPILFALLFKIIDLVSAISDENVPIEMYINTSGIQITAGLSSHYNRHLFNYTSRLTNKSINVEAFDYGLSLILSRLLSGYYYWGSENKFFSASIAFYDLA
ncbi:MAG: PAS domain-containing protein [Thermodesulfovibrionales bacterium]